MEKSPLYIPGEPVFNPQYESKASGSIIIDGKEVASTLQCAHCGAHWVPIRGSKRRRGFCTICKKTTCGALPCDVCISMKTRKVIGDAQRIGDIKTIKKIVGDMTSRQQKIILPKIYGKV